MKLFTAIVATLILAGIGSAGIYQLGGYAVSFDVGIPATVMEITPIYDSQRWAWTYQLNILPGNDSVADSNDSWQMAIGIDKYKTPREANALEIYATHRRDDKIASGVQGYKNAIVDYSGYAANIESSPYQTVKGPGGMFSVFPKTYQLFYMLDDKTAVTVSSIGASNELFTQLINSLKIKEKGNSMYKESFVGKTSDWDGPGNGSDKNRNAFSVLGDPAESSLLTPLGVGG
jgi:hypothetical protein